MKKTIEIDEKKVYEELENGELVDKDELFDKDITQLETVEPVIRALGDMGKIWKEITEKLEANDTCYVCKKKLTRNNNDKVVFDIVSVPYNKVDIGMIAFVSICKKCNE